MKKILNLFKALGFSLHFNPAMPLRIYSKAPDFTLQTAENESFNLKKTLEIKSVLLLFYPKAFTAGCTAEACGFRDDYSFFENRNIQIVGISHDLEETQSRFAKRYKLPFTLLSDPSRTVCRLYDAVYPFGLLTKRVSYLINQEGLISIAYENLFNPAEHLEQIKSRILAQEKEQRLVRN